MRLSLARDISRLLRPLLLKERRTEEKAECECKRFRWRGTDTRNFRHEKFSALLSPSFLLALPPLFFPLVSKLPFFFPPPPPRTLPLFEAMQSSLAQSTRVAVPTARRTVAVRAAARPER